MVCLKHNQQMSAIILEGFRQEECAEQMDIGRTIIFKRGTVK